jgi:hypothetical protein
MKNNQFMRLSRKTALVRKYQAHWEFCLDQKTRSYHWPGETAPRN